MPPYAPAQSRASALPTFSQREGRTSRTDAHARALNWQLNWWNWQNRQSTELAENYPPHKSAGMLSLGRPGLLGPGCGFPGPAMAAKATRAASRIPVRVMKSGCGHAVRQVRLMKSGSGHVLRPFESSPVRDSRCLRSTAAGTQDHWDGPTAEIPSALLRWRIACASGLTEMTLR